MELLPLEKLPVDDVTLFWGVSFGCPRQPEIIVGVSGGRRSRKEPSLYLRGKSHPLPTCSAFLLPDQ